MYVILYVDILNLAEKRIGFFLIWRKNEKESCGLHWIRFSLRYTSESSFLGGKVVHLFFMTAIFFFKVLLKTILTRPNLAPYAC